jgi:RNA polymerase sigma-70 factor, ECF subfamily
VDAEPDDADDRALLTAAAAGDGDAFGRLVRRHRARLWAVAVRTLGDREEAADALQDALLSAYRASGSYRGDARVTTWLHRIVVNACLDRARRAAVRPTVPLLEGREPADPHDRTSEHDTALALQAALAALPAEQRVALVLVDLQGLPVQEAARVLGVPEGTVKSRCARGRARLAVALGHLRPDPERPDPERPDPERPDPGRPDPGRPDHLRPGSAPVAPAVPDRLAPGARP